MNSYTKHLQAETEMVRKLVLWEKQNVSSLPPLCQSFYGEAKTKYLAVIEDQFNLVSEMMGLPDLSNQEVSQSVVKKF